MHNTAKVTYKLRFSNIGLAQKCFIPVRPLLQIKNPVEKKFGTYFIEPQCIAALQHYANSNKVGQWSEWRASGKMSARFIDLAKGSLTIW